MALIVLSLDSCHLFLTLRNVPENEQFIGTVISCASSLINSITVNRSYWTQDASTQFAAAAAVCATPANETWCGGCGKAFLQRLQQEVRF